MRVFSILILLFILVETSIAQSDKPKFDFNTIDSLYREDQLFFGFHINLMNNLPSNVTQSGLSGGIIAGFIRDMPLNKRRNIALGVGAGFSANTYGHNLFVGRDEFGNGVFEALNREEVDYSNNRFSTYIVEMPIQFRWRTSTPSSTSFYRIYAGLNLGYMYHFRSRFEGDGLSLKFSNLKELNRWRTGIHLSMGSNFVNFHIQYNFNSLFDAKLQGTNESIEIEILKFGFIFYML